MQKIKAMLKSAVALTLLSIFLPTPLASADEAEPVRAVAVLDMTKRNDEVQSSSGDFTGQLYSAQYICDVAGYPYITTESPEEAYASAPVVVLSSGFNSQSMTAAEYQAMIDWVKEGGILVMPAMRQVAQSGKELVAELLGIKPMNSANNNKNRKLITWVTTNGDYPETAYFDEPEEKVTSIGTIRSYSYTLPEDGGAEVMARFDDGSPAVLLNRLGKGKVYLAGVNWRDVILRSQLNKDQSASREYNNGFEPSADMWAFWLRSIVASNQEVSAWKFTVPGGFTQLLIPTHDVDSRTSFDEMHYMADYERTLGCNAHYFITTHYFRDKDYHDTSYLSAFYNSETIPKCRDLLRAGHSVGSHSVCHFPDFSSTKNMDVVTRDEYARRATCVDGKSTGASTWAEVVMSKQILEEDLKNHVRSFRSGHLCYNTDLPEAFEIGEYDFASTFAAGDLLSEFPFYVRYGNDWAGRVTDILQIPLHISDVYSGKDKPALNDDTWRTHPCVDQWENAMRRLRGNYASAVLLIHPNRNWKMVLERHLVDRLDLSEVGCYNFEDYGDFWKARVKTDYTMEWDPEEKTLTIETEDYDAVIRNKMTFAVEAKEMPRNVIVSDANGDKARYCTLRKIADGRWLAVPDGSSGIKDVYDDNDPLTGKKHALSLTREGLLVEEDGDLSLTGVDGLTVKTIHICHAPEVVGLTDLTPGIYIATLPGSTPLKVLVR